MSKIFFCPGCQHWHVKRKYNQTYCTDECRTVFTWPLVAYKQKINRRRRKEGREAAEAMAHG